MWAPVKVRNGFGSEMAASKALPLQGRLAANGPVTAGHLRAQLKTWRHRNKTVCKQAKLVPTITRAWRSAPKH